MAQSTRRGAPPLLWAIALFSLMFNIVLCGVLIAGYVAVRSIAGQAADELEKLANSTIATTVKIDRDIALDLAVPFTFSETVAIQQNIPINTIVPINQDIPLLGTVKFDVPINAVVPISTSVPISIKQTIPIKTSIPIAIDVPVAIQVRDTPLKQQIDSFAAILRRIAGR